MSSQDIFDLGYGDNMLPVIPPGAKISPASTVKDTGKTPGKLGVDGWFGVNLKKERCKDQKEAKRWDEWGASTGLAAGRNGLVFLDVDVGEQAFNNKFRELLAAHGMETASERFVDAKGHHKFAVLLRVVEDEFSGEPVVVASRDIRFEWQGQRTAVQILGNGKQAVIAGTHAGTGKPYKWAWPGLPPADDLFFMTREKFESFLAAFEQALPGWGATPLSTPSSQRKGRAARHEEETSDNEEELRSWLELVPNTLAQFPGRDEWVQMLYAIYGASGGADWGRALWLEWCEPIPQTPGLPEAYWDRITPDEVRSGMSAIRHWARANEPGKAAALMLADAPELEEMVDQARRERKLWPALMQRYCFNTSAGRFIDMVTGRDAGRDALDIQLAYLIPELRGNMPVGTEKEVLRTFTTMWAGQKERITVEDQTYHPGRPRIMDGEGDTLLFNRWRPGYTKFLSGVTQADVQPFYDLAELVTNNAAEPGNLEKVLKWMAFVVQKPDLKPNWGILLQSGQGLGKDTLMETFSFAVGKDNTGFIGSEELCSSFNEHLENKLLLVNEAKQRGKNNHDVYNEFKRITSRPPEFLTINKKNVRPYKIQNLIAVVVMTNEDNPLALENDDRRFFVIDSRRVVKPQPIFYANYRAWLNNGGFEKVASYLMNYPLTAQDIADLQGPAPGSAAKDALASLNRNPVLVALEEVVEESRLGFGPFPLLVCTVQDMATVLRERGLTAFGSSSYLGRYMNQIEGVGPVRSESKKPHIASPIMRNGKGSRLWRLGDVDAQGNNVAMLTPTQLAELYDAKRWAFPTTPATVTPIRQPDKNFGVL